MFAFKLGSLLFHSSLLYSVYITYVHCSKLLSYFTCFNFKLRFYKIQSCALNLSTAILILRETPKIHVITRSSHYNFTFRFYSKLHNSISQPPKYILNVSMYCYLLGEKPKINVIPATYMGLGLCYMFGYWDIGVAGIDVSHLVPADEDAIIHRHAAIH